MSSPVRTSQVLPLRERGSNHMLPAQSGVLESKTARQAPIHRTAATAFIASGARTLDLALRHHLSDTVIAALRAKPATAAPKRVL